MVNLGGGGVYVPRSRSLLSQDVVGVVMLACFHPTTARGQQVGGGGGACVGQVGTEWGMGAVRD